MSVWSWLIGTATANPNVLIVGILLAVILGIYIYAQFCERAIFRTSRHHRFLVSVRALWEGLLSLIFPTLAAINTFILLPPIYGDHVRYVRDPILCALYIPGIVLLYQIECLARQQLQSRRLPVQRRSTPPTPAPIDPIEKELNDLKTKLGLSQPASHHSSGFNHHDRAQR